MTLTHDQPFELLFAELRSGLIWPEIETRLLKVRDNRLRLLVASKPETSAAELQRHIGFMEGINRVLAEPHLLQAELTRQRDAENKGVTS